MMQAKEADALCNGLVGDTSTKMDKIFGGK